MRAGPGGPEVSLVLFTVLAPAAAGVAAVGAFAPPPGLFATALVLLVAGGAAAALHLGRVGRARFALSNLRTSWLSRETLLAGLFGAALGAAVAAPGVRAVGVAAAVIGLLLVGGISGVYRLRTVPPWDTWMTPAAFYLAAVVLGTSISAAVIARQFVEIGLLRAAAAAAVVQVVLAAAHFLRFGRRGLRGALAARVGTTLAGAALALSGAPWATWSAVVLFAAGELLGRHLFYASHRRPGL